MSKWTDEEVSKLKEYYPSHTNQYISENILERRTKTAIGDKARKIGLEKNNSHSDWNEKEEKILREKFPIHSSIEISERFIDRTPTAIRQKADRLNIYTEPNSQHDSASEIECELCGNSYEYQANSGRSKIYCKSCLKRRKSIAYKDAIINILGGSCSLCSYSTCHSVLSAHHKDGGKKEMSLNNLANKSYSKIATELESIQLVCENCHNKKHCEGSRGYCPEHNWDKRCCNKDNSCNRSCYVMHLRHERRLSFIEQKGGECDKCGYSGCTGVLSFHHRNPDEKEFSLDVTAFSRSIKSLENEVDKCDLLCHNCHRKHHCECEVKCSDIFNNYAEHAEEQIKECL